MRAIIILRVTLIIIAIFLPLTNQYMWHKYGDKCYMTGEVFRLEKWKIDQCKYDISAFVCNNCRLNVIDEDAFLEANLEELSIENNFIDKIGSWINELSDVKLLRLTNNNITTLKNGTFKMNLELQMLILSHNNINVVEMDAFDKNLDRLYFVDLSHNQLKAISNEFRHLTKLYHIDLSHNKIWSVEKNAFANCKSLREIFLSYNKLVTLPKKFYDKSSLRRLYLAGNRLKDTSFLDDSVNMDTIDLSDNDLKELSFSNTKSLNFLYLHDNNLKSSLILNAMRDNLKTLEHISINTKNYWTCSGLIDFFDLIEDYEITVLKKYDYDNKADLTLLCIP